VIQYYNTEHSYIYLPTPQPSRIFMEYRFFFFCRDKIGITEPGNIGAYIPEPNSVWIVLLFLFSESFEELRWVALEHIVFL
jgi:hypothetical protein